MTNQQHPITPPPELVAKLWREASAGRDDAPIGEIFNHGVLLAYAAGADQELEACLMEVEQMFCWGSARDLRAARRPKPPSLKEQALKALDHICVNHSKATDHECTIRRALAQLPDE
jgi:hypothetical protein